MNEIKTNVVTPHSSKYADIVSLGFNCSLAQNLKKLSIRDRSFPFDWVISPLNEIAFFVEKGFSDLLSYKNMAQDKDRAIHYCDVKHKIWFYHDFDWCIPLGFLLPFIRKKYKRRWNRFVRKLKTGVLLLRVVKDKNELLYLANNVDYFVNLFKKINPNNDVFFILDCRFKENDVPNDCRFFYSSKNSENMEMLLEDIDGLKPILQQVKETKAHYYKERSYKESFFWYYYRRLLQRIYKKHYRFARQVSSDIFDKQ